MNSVSALENGQREFYGKWLDTAGDEEHDPTIMSPPDLLHLAESLHTELHRMYQLPAGDLHANLPDHDVLELLMRVVIHLIEQNMRGQQGLEPHAIAHLQQASGLMKCALQPA